MTPPPSNIFHHSPKNYDFPEKGIISPQIGSFKMIIRQNIHFASNLIFWARMGWGISKGTTGYLIRVPFKCVLPIVARHLFAGVLALICGCAKTCGGTGVQMCRLDRVVVRSRSQIVKPDALFVVFLGIKWAHDIVKKNRS